MDLRCPHCGEPVKPGMKICPRCEAELTPPKSRKPQTINELYQYCMLKNIPLEKLRFFIGEDYREPKAFGIYRKDNGDFVVYKNKADGTRAVRYEGPDEAFAVNEIYQKLLSEAELRREKKQGGPTRSRSRGAGCAILGILITVLISAVIAFAVLMFARSGPSRGYYYYNDDYYYYQNDSWYEYDDGWYPVYADDTLEEDYAEYWVEDDYDDAYGVAPFSDSEYYQAYDESDWDDDDWDDWDDWDDDDWDDWDTDDTDWDSDW